MWIKIPCGTRVSKTQIPVGTNHARRQRDPRRRRKKTEEEEDLNKTICNLSNLIQFHLSSIVFSFKSFTSLWVVCNLFRSFDRWWRSWTVPRSMIRMWLMETGFVCAMGLLLCCGSSSSFFLSFYWVSFFLLSFFWVFFFFWVCSSLLCVFWNWV